MEKRETMQTVREYAPVLIPTLNRYEHFKRCVESLANCTHADKTELVIGLDFPPSERYHEGWKKIAEYVDSVVGFKKVTVLRSDRNLGAIANSQRIREYISDKYQTYIYTEDDNVFSPCFLDYMNKTLTRYWDDKRVNAVCGYNYPVNMENYDKNIYAYHQYSAWGVGRWIHKFEVIPDSFSQNVFKSPSKVFKIMKTEPQMVFVLMRMVGCGQKWGDAIMVVSNILTGHYSIFPKVSLCRNYGHDGSGIHCGGEKDDQFDVYRNQYISSDSIFELDDILIEDIRNRELKRFFHMPLKQKISSLKLYFKHLISIL